jgi:hypothetical protein
MEHDYGAHGNPARDNSSIKLFENSSSQQGLLCRQRAVPIFRRTWDDSTVGHTTLTVRGS